MLLKGELLRRGVDRQRQHHWGSGWGCQGVARPTGVIFGTSRTVAQLFSREAAFFCLVTVRADTGSHRKLPMRDQSSQSEPGNVLSRGLARPGSQCWAPVGQGGMRKGVTGDWLPPKAEAKGPKPRAPRRRRNLRQTRVVVMRHSSMQDDGCPGWFASQNE